MPTGRKSTQSSTETPTAPGRRVEAPGPRGGGRDKVAESGRRGPGTPFLAASPVFWAAAAGIWIPFAGCKDFYQNTTNRAVTITITIRNKSKNSTMFVDVSGTKVAEIPPGETLTLVIELPADGGFIHADVDGEYLV